VASVEDFIKNKLDANKTAIEDSYNHGEILFSKADIDFLQLNISIDGTTKHLNDWLYSINKYSSYSNWADLRGINLSGIKIHSSTIRNACFSNANFSDSIFNNVDIKNCNFNESDFSGSFLAIINFDKPCLSNCNFKSAQLNGMEIGGDTIGSRPIIKKISYFNLVATALLCRQVKTLGTHTKFSAIKITEPKNGFQKKNISYIAWYQDTITKYTNFNQDNFFYSTFLRIKNTATAITSMNWRSVGAVGGSAVIVNMIYAAAYYKIGSNGFNCNFDSYLTALYFSVVTFTTLGYGDITPLKTSKLTQSLIMSELVIGFVVLGVLLYLFTNKINEQKI
jgi:uncharacterized protein YjbI with pentapeptide repeats